MWLYEDMLYFAMLCYAILLLGYAMQCYAKSALSYTMLYYAMPCYAMLYSVPFSIPYSDHALYDINSILHAVQCFILYALLYAIPHLQSTLYCICMLDSSLYFAVKALYYTPYDTLCQTPCDSTIPHPRSTIYYIFYVREGDMFGGFFIWPSLYNRCGMKVFVVFLGC